MEPVNAAPNRKALETGFLILSLLPRPTTAVDTIKEAANRVSGVRMRVMRETSYDRCSAQGGARTKDWSRFWRACMSFEAPGVRVNDVGLTVPEYPLAEPYDVHRCDLTRLAEAVWSGVGRIREETQSDAAA